MGGPSRRCCPHTAPSSNDALPAGRQLVGRSIQQTEGAAAARCGPLVAAPPPPQPYLTAAALLLPRTLLRRRQVLGYVYPAYRTFKVVQLPATRANDTLLRKWCCYWCLMAALTAVQPVLDTFLFWVRAPLGAAALHRCRGTVMPLWWHGGAGAAVAASGRAPSSAPGQQPLVLHHMLRCSQVPFYYEAKLALAVYLWANGAPWVLPPAGAAARLPCACLARLPCASRSRHPSFRFLPSQPPPASHLSPTPIPPHPACRRPGRRAVRVPALVPAAGCLVRAAG